MSVKPILLTLFFFVLSYGDTNDEVEWFPVSFGGGMEVGQLVNTRYWENNNNYDSYVFPRLGIAMTYHAAVQERMDIQVGVGGLFWYAFPQEGNFWETTTKFGPGISKAQAVYTFGDPGKSTTYIQLGFFPMKYNPEASNLGEYLFRSGTYPGFLRTGGWTIVNSAAYMGQGLRFHFENLDGMLQHDFTLFLEKEFWPINDLTPSYLLSFRNGMLEAGAGVSLHHFIPMRPSALETKRPVNHYVEYKYFPATVNQDTLYRPSGVLGMTELDFLSTGLRDTVQDRNPVRDSISVSIADRNVFVYDDDPAYQANPAGYESIENHKDDFYYTHKGVKLMGRVTLNFNELMGADFKLFAEAAVLGVKNYPFFYENLSERIPVMFGVNVPTFGLLDVLSLQGEYYRSSFRNTLEMVYTSYSPIPSRFPNDAEITEDDNFHWSFLASKTLTQGLKAYVQVASDHLRLIRPSYGYTWEPLTSSSSQWYYIAKIEFGI